MLKVVNNESTLVSKELKLFYCYREVRNLALSGGRTIVRFFTLSVDTLSGKKKKKLSICRDKMVANLP